ncbi:MAG: HEM-1/HEM-2 family protein [Comamonadaceae bacterium]|nr:HEM-1/HEM-2 family protein [Comamonadaceae bacterium]
MQFKSEQIDEIKAAIAEAHDAFERMRAEYAKPEDVKA